MKEFLLLAKLFAHPAGAFVSKFGAHHALPPFIAHISQRDPFFCSLSLFIYFLSVPRIECTHARYSRCACFSLVNVSLAFISFAYGAENIFCSGGLIFMYSSSSLKRWKIKLYTPRDLVSFFFAPPVHESAWVYVSPDPLISCYLLKRARKRREGPRKSEGA